MKLTPEDLKAIEQLLGKSLDDRLKKVHEKFDKQDGDLEGFFRAMTNDFRVVNRKLDAHKQSLRNLIRELHYKGISIDEKDVLEPTFLDNLQEEKA